MERVPLTHASKPRSYGLFVCGGHVPKGDSVTRGACAAGGMFAQVPVLCPGKAGHIIVGVLPRQVSVHVLRWMLLRRRGCPGLRCAFLVPLRNRFQHHWASFYRYYRRLRQSAIRSGSRNWVLRRRLDAAADGPAYFESCVLPEAHVLIGF